MPRNERKGFSREERMQAFHKKAVDQQKRGGLFYLRDEEELEGMNIRKFVPKEGSVFISILPRVDDPCFFQEIFVHYDVGPNRYAFLCPQKMYGERCPVCEYREQLIKDGADKEEFKEFYPGRRNLMFIVDKKDKRTVSEGVQLYDAPPGIIAEIDALITDKRTNEVTIDIIEDGYEVCYKRIGKNIGTKYKSFTLEKSELAIPVEYYDDVVPIEDVLIEPDIDEMEKAMGLKPSRPIVAETRQTRKEEKEPEKSSRNIEPEVEVDADNIGYRRGRQSDEQEETEQQESRPVRRLGKAREEEKPEKDEVQEKGETIRSGLRRRRDRV